MTIAMRDAGGALRQITGWTVRDDAGVLRTLSKIVRRDDQNVLRMIWEAIGPLAAFANPGTSFGGIASNTTSSVSTSIVSIVASGGVSPYTYSCVRIDVNAGTWSIVQSGAGFSFRVAAVPANATRDATFRITVTDARGVTLVVPDVIATAENYGGLQ